MEDTPGRNYDLTPPDIFAFFNHYFLLLFGLSCILGSLFVQEVFIMFGQFQIAISVAPALGILLPIYLVTRRFPAGFRRQFRIGRPRPRIALYVTLATLAMVVVVSHLYVTSQRFMPPPEAYNETLKQYRPTSALGAVVTFLGLCVVVPFAEEVVFRGVVQEIFRRNMNSALAVILAGVFFGVMHLNPQLLAGLVCFGIFLGIVFHLTSNLSYAILGHGVLNAVAFLQLTLLPEEALETPPFYMREWWMLPVSVAVTTILLREIKRGVSSVMETPGLPSDSPEWK
ncbi:MAG: lysostaphin resistance A-like protein [Candidatus Krumholzibacteriia bacterium]